MSAQLLPRAAAVVFEQPALLIGQAGEALAGDFVEQAVGFGVEIVVGVLGVVHFQRRPRLKPLFGLAEQSLELVETWQAAKIPAEVPVAKREGGADEVDVVGDAACER